MRESAKPSVLKERDPFSERDCFSLFYFAFPILFNGDTSPDSISRRLRNDGLDRERICRIKKPPPNPVLIASIAGRYERKSEAISKKSILSLFPPISLVFWQFTKNFL